MRHGTLAVVLATALLCTHAAADDAGGEPPAEPAPAARPEFVEEILVKGRKGTRVETMETREVRESPARDLAEALAQHGLAAAIRKGGIANDVVVRGFQRDNLAVTIDGAKLHGACPNRMDPPSFHVDYAEVDRVELRKGPFDVASQGGLGGTLDVRTRSPRAGASGEVNAGYGRFGSLETSATLGYGGERFGLLGGGAYKEAKAFESGDGLRFTEIYAADSANRYRADALGRDAYGVRTGWAKATASPIAGHRAELSFAHQQADDVLYPYLKMDARYDDTSRVNAAWDGGAAGPLSRTRAQAYFTHVRHDMDDARRCSSSEAVASCGALLPRGWSMRTLAESWVAGGALEAAFSTVGETVVGVDLSVRSWSSSTTRYRRMAPVGYFEEDSIPDVATSDVGLRAQHTLDVGGRVTLQAGARVDLVRSDPGEHPAEYAKYYADVPADLRQDDVLLSGNVQADVHLARFLSAFAGYGHGERVPDAQERFFALSPMAPGRTAAGTVGRPTLDPVRNDELDVGAKLILGPVLVKAQLFHSWLTDHVALVEVSQLANPTLLAKSWENVSATMWGGEASARVALPWDLYASASLAYTEGRNRTRGTWLAEMPPLRGAASLRYDRTRWFGEVETVLADDQHSVDDLVREQPTGGWAILNLKAGVTVAGARLSAGVRNAFDRSYHESLSHLRDPFASGVRVPEPGRVVYANVQAGF